MRQNDQVDVKRTMASGACSQLLTTHDVDAAARN